MENAKMNSLIAQYPLVKDLVALKETTWFNPGTTSLAEGLPYVGLTEQDVQDAHARLIAQYPLVKDLVALKETTWFNPGTTSLAEGLPYVGLTEQDVQDAHARLSRFAPYLAKAFPETAAAGGIIESELVAIPAMQKRLEKEYQQPISGQLLLKKDSHLPISGSIKARGGIYEVLAHTEKLALEAGLLTLDDDYSKLLSPEFKQFFSQYSIAVGSTGNLGLSIGIMSARIGFKVTVHMSADARAWKKAKLRSHGVTVVEYEQDYGVAVEEGRKAAQSDPNCFFIDDENSRTLFLGYSVAGQRLKMSKIMVLPSRKDVKQRSLTRTVSLLMTKIPARCSLGIPSQASVLKRNLPSKVVLSMLITLCLSICRVVLAVVLVASHSGLNWRLAIMFTALLPNQRTHLVCC